MDASMMSRLKELEVENQCLKAEIVREAIEKKW
jgi:predicted DNA-binding protein